MLGFLLVVLFVAAFWGISVVWTRDGRARSRLNNQGLPRPTNRADHRINDEE